MGQRLTTALAALAAAGRAALAALAAGGRAVIRRLGVDALLASGLALLAAGFRLVGLASAYDTHIDEPFYVFMANSIGEGRLVPLNQGVPFLLHPPGYFFVIAGWRAVLGSDGDLFQQVFQARYLQQIFAVGSAVAVYYIVRQLSGRTAAAVASGLFAIDSFVLLQNSRLLLETAAFTFVLAGVLVLCRTAALTGFRGWSGSAGGGLLFGYAIFIKDLSVLVTVVPLAGMLGLPRWLPRARVLVALAASVLPTLGYLGVLVAHGLVPRFWQIKLSGAQRMAGVRVSTGYTAEHAPSLLSSALARLSGYGSSYFLMACGLLAVAVLMARRTAEGGRVFLGLLTASALGLVVYGYLFGTVEEQFFYFVTVTSIMSISIVAVEFAMKPIPWLRPRWLTTAVVTTTLAVVGLVDLNAWVNVRRHPDNGQQVALDWLERHVPPGTKVGWVALHSGYHLRDRGYRPVHLGAPDQMVARDVRYLLLLDSIVRKNYSSIDRRYVDWYRGHSVRVFSFRSRSFGEVAIYRLAAD